MNKIPIIYLFSSLMLILPIMIGIIDIKAIKNTPSMIILSYCILFSCFEIVSWYYALHGWQNHFIENIVNYVDIIFIECFYLFVVSNSFQKKLILFLIIISIIVVATSNIEDSRSFNRMDAFAKSFVNLVIIFTSLLFFYQIQNSLEIKNLFTYSYFWISTSLLIYFSGIFFVNIFAEYITFNKDESINSYWDIKEYLTVFHRIILAVGLWFSKTPQQLSSSSK